MTNLSNKAKRRKLKSDFVLFLKYMFKRTGLPEPTKYQILMADILQKEKDPRVVILAYRGFAKSTIQYLYLLWEIWKDPTKQHAIWGQNQDFAAGAVSMILNIIKTFPEFSDICPRFGDKQSSLGFDTPHKPAHVKGSTLQALSIGGAIVGSRADTLVIDDPETTQNGYTQQRRENLDRAMSEATAVIKQGGKIRVLGTVHFDRSLYLRLKNKGYKIYIIPICVPPKEVADLCWTHYPKQVRDDITNNPVWTPLDRFNSEDIELRRSEGDIYFERQYLMNLYRSSSSIRPFDLSKIILFDANSNTIPQSLEFAREPQYVADDMTQYSGADLGEKFYRPFKVDDKVVKYDLKVAYIDPASTGKDELALMIGGAGGGRAVLFHSEGMNGLTIENVERCIDKALEYKVDQILVESNLNTAPAFVRAIMDEKYAPRFGRAVLPQVVPIHNQQSKTLRIESLDSVINGGRMVITPGALISDFNSAQDKGVESFVDYTLTAQISNFSNKDQLPRDDRIDALAGLIRELSPYLDITPEKSKMDREFEMIENLFKSKPGRVNLEDIGTPQIKNLWRGRTTR